MKRRIVDNRLFLILGCLALSGCGCSKQGGYAAPPLAFDGDSRALRASVVAPTLDTPIDPTQNVIWCATFQLAWDALKTATNTPVLPVQHAEEVSARLDASPVSMADVPPGSAFATAGQLADGVLEEIAATLQARFPSIPAPDWEQTPLPPDAYVAFAALETSTAFDPPYHQSDDALTFTPAKGNPKDVRSFGILPEDSDAYPELREQVEVLFHAFREGDPNGEMLSFALDLARNQDVQVIVAVIEPEKDLAGMLEQLNERHAAFSKAEHYEYYRTFGPSERFQAPEMNWRVNHHFEELTGRDKVILAGDAAGMWIIEAMQMINFTFDRSGARVSSTAHITAAAEPRSFRVDRPFLLVLRQRGAQHPFFVMWVANAELLNVQD